MFKSKIYKYCAILIFSSLILSSCMTSQETNYLQTLNIPYPKEGYKEYRLCVDDNIRCSIYTKNTEFANTFNKVVGTDENAGNVYVIYHNGCVLLPYFGEIKIVGLTLEEAENLIQTKIQESILDVQVNITLVNNYYYLLSDRGSKRGQFSIYKENMTIYQALAQFGNTDRNLDYRNVQIIRKDAEGNTYVKSFDLRSKDIIQSEFYYVKPNDMYYFATNKNSFFNITSLSTFISTVLTPVTLFIMATRVKFN